MSRSLVDTAGQEAGMSLTGIMQRDPRLTTPGPLGAPRTSSRCDATACGVAATQSLSSVGITPQNFSHHIDCQSLLIRRWTVNGVASFLAVKRIACSTAAENGDVPKSSPPSKWQHIAVGRQPISKIAVSNTRCADHVARQALC